MSNDQNPSPTDPAPDVTIIGESIRIQGTMTSRGDVHMNQMEVNGCLTIGAGGKADANVKAHEVIVAGSAKGNVETIDRLVLRASANLEGDVKTPRIVIEEGACFKGGIETVRPPSS